MLRTFPRHAAPKPPRPERRVATPRRHTGGTEAWGRAMGAKPAAARERLQGIDLLRGLVIVIMALDHVRDFWSPTPFPPEDLSQASPALFLTRWITHYCAPTFVFLAGASAWFYAQSTRSSKRELGKFLAQRGLWLVLLEIVIVNPSWDASPLNFFFLQVIWAIGIAMLALALLVQGPRWLPLAAGVAIVLLHNALDPLEPEQFGAASTLWRLLHEGGFLTPRFGGVVAVYPVLPWIGVMALGYGVAPWLAGPLRRDRWLMVAGLSMIAAFFLLRLTDGYGDARPWAPNPRGELFTWLGLLNVTKYPPSLQFLLMTLGPALLLLVALEKIRSPLLKPLQVFGRVPMFFYLIHVPVIMLSAVAWAMLEFGQPVNFFAGPGGVPADYAPSLPRAYVVWLAVVFVLYWPCRWFAGYKQAHPEKTWLRFL
jgi:uncharacterized membrane protein